ncbi:MULTISPECIES: hypothetical protein [Sphingomonadaceae]|uniref:Peptidase M10 metallopeptidase domain-containing protein n=3 Tax=Sphingomonadaceae TaxID=41297 RepID=A0A2A4I5P1_9SPHN|nr:MULTISPECIES: hypothetical protein [Sphingomonadaceae]MBN2974236.1 hypothetical protein [Roseomonas aeriglobus]KEQ54980.1 hypothetical protein BV95_00725 [Sphingobium chlorophenolicum]PCG13120.1 hypothetical protein COA07_16060 [Sphingomonas adhaesiva]PZU71769.1 MAG: hypothetical protein DI530_18515 [Sphingomonas sp.]RSU72592.1 hypothetical protein DAH54_23560 [Sphingomonas koreensis]
MKKITLIAALAAIISSGSASAQTIGPRWPTTTKSVYLHIAMPAGCDPALGRAVSNWNAQGSRFYYQWDAANNLTTTRGTETTAQIVTVEDGYPTNSTALASTNLWTSGSTITQADVIVKADYLWYYGDESGGRFHCPSTRSSPPSGSFDYESTMTHELGHALGFGEANNTACVMHYSQPAGVVRRTPCSTETTALRNAYGVR